MMFIGLDPIQNGVTEAAVSAGPGNRANRAHRRKYSNGVNRIVAHVNRAQKGESRGKPAGTIRLL